MTGAVLVRRSHKTVAPSGSASPIPALPRVDGARVSSESRGRRQCGGRRREGGQGAGRRPAAAQRCLRRRGAGNRGRCGPDGGASNDGASEAGREAGRRLWEPGARREADGGGSPWRGRRPAAEGAGGGERGGGAAEVEGDGDGDVGRMDKEERGKRKGEREKRKRKKRKKEEKNKK